MSQSQNQSVDLFGLLAGSITLVIIAAFWAVFGLTSLTGPLRVGGLALSAAISLVLWLGLVNRLRQLRRRSSSDTPDRSRRSRRLLGLFGVDGLQLAAIVAVSNILTGLGWSEWIGPAIALIVGLHFLPLAYLFQVRIYTVSAAALCLLAGLAVFVPAENRGLVISLGGAVILWATAGSNWLDVTRRMQSLPPPTL